MKEPKFPHGRDKELEADDPMEMTMVSVPGGNPDLMATCLIEEYARMGMDQEEIFGLFSQPIYQTHAFYRERGEAWLRDRIKKVLAQSGRIGVSIKRSPLTLIDSE